MAEPLSAALSIVKSTWRAVEFARSAYHARSDASQLWARTNDLYVLIEKIDFVVREHADPFDEDIVLIVQKALKASNRTLDELARRCLNLGDRDDINLWYRTTRPISFTLSCDSIQKFEQQLQTNIMSVQIAFFLLGRGEQQELTRRINDLLIVLETAVQFIAHHAPPTRRRPGVLGVSGPSLTALENLDECVEAATSTMTLHNILTASPQLLTIETSNEVPESPLQRLTSLESEAWGEIAGQRSLSAVSSERMEAINSSAVLIDSIKDHSRETFQRLLDDGSNINGTDDQDYTPLMHTAHQHGRSCNECLRCMHALLDLNVNVDADRNGETALHMSINHDNLDAARVLLAKGASVDASWPKTPLMLAVQSNKSAFVELLLTSTPAPDVNVVDRDKWGLIHHATWNNRKDVLLTLLSHNKALELEMDLDARCTMDWTPLMRLAENAERSRSVKLATILLDHGADVNTTDLCERSALYYAVTTGVYSPQRNDFVQLLLEKGADADDVRSKASKRVVERFPALKREDNRQRRDSAHSNSETSPVSRRGSRFGRRWSRN